MDISNWLTVNNLKLNSDKTELLNVLSPRHLLRHGRLALNIDGYFIRPSQCVRVLGVILDEHLSMANQISSVIKSCNFHLRNIGKVRKYLTTGACKTAVQSLVVSRMDYCCSLLAGVPANRIRRLQVVQNRAARIIARVIPRDHISPVLANLHWIPCDYRVKFRILTFVYKCLHHSSPAYFPALITQYQPRRTLRSSSDKSLLASKPSSKRIGNYAFSHTAPELWNKLPINIRNACSVSTFKSLLKTHYFKEVYG